MTPPEKVEITPYYLYKLRDSKLSWNGNEFTGLSGVLGAPLGWAIIEDLKTKGITVKEVPIHDNSPDLLIQQRLEGFICLESVFDSYLQRKPEAYKDIVKEQLPLWEKPYYLMLSRQFVQQRPDLAEKIWDTIKEIKNTEAYSRLVDKYFD